MRKLRIFLIVLVLACLLLSVCAKKKSKRTKEVIDEVEIFTDEDDAENQVDKEIKALKRKAEKKPLSRKEKKLLATLIKHQLKKGSSEEQGFFMWLISSIFALLVNFIAFIIFGVLFCFGCIRLTCYIIKRKVVNFADQCLNAGNNSINQFVQNAKKQKPTLTEKQLLAKKSFFQKNQWEIEFKPDVTYDVYLQEVLKEMNQTPEQTKNQNQTASGAQKANNTSTTQKSVWNVTERIKQKVEGQRSEMPNQQKAQTIFKSNVLFDTIVERKEKQWDITLLTKGEFDNSTCSGILTFKGDRLALAFEKVAKYQGLPEEAKKMYQVALFTGVQKKTSSQFEGDFSYKTIFDQQYKKVGTWSMYPKHRNKKNKKE